MALFDFNRPATPRSSHFKASATAKAAQVDALRETTENLHQLRLALDFVAARQALTRKHLAAAQTKRDRGYQQSQFAHRAENRALHQRAQRRERENAEAIQQLVMQLTQQTEQVASLEERIITIQDQLAGLEGMTAAAPNSPCSALMPPGLMERFTGQIEL